jgi:hypothetical protein
MRNQKAPTGVRPLVLKSFGSGNRFLIRGVLGTGSTPLALEGEIPDHGAHLFALVSKSGLSGPSRKCPGKRIHFGAPARGLRDALRGSL